MPLGFQSFLCGSWSWSANRRFTHSVIMILTIFMKAQYIEIIYNALITENWDTH